jgi:hypothetical protein
MGHYKLKRLRYWVSSDINGFPELFLANEIIVMPK